MELVTSRIRPTNFQYNNFSEKFEELAEKADFIKITTAFASLNSILFLKENVQAQLLPNIEISYGMHAFDYFTKSQYNAAKTFAEYLDQNSKGQAHICTAFPFHGKVYSFWKNYQIQSALVGSSNLSALDSANQKLFEVDIVIDDNNVLQSIDNLQKEIIIKASVPFLNWQPTKFKQTRSLMQDINGVNKILSAEVETAKKFNGRKYKLKLKAEEKSNLNVYFGKGRLNTRSGLIRPRPWYEIEVIVSASTTSQPGYPFKRNFDVITDDGWSFKCKTSGDYSKNFRSEGGLIVLGSWIKGRLEEAGIIKVGEKIIDQHLQDYGRNDLTLSETSDPNTWYLSFDPND